MNEKYFQRLINTLNSSYGCFMLWKQIRTSISIPDSGKEEAERRARIINQYGGIFTGILYATENTFITDLHKLFDKPRTSLKLETLMKSLPETDQKKVRSLISSVEKEVERIKVLRDNVTAHNAKNPEEEKIHVEEIEKIFSVVQEILNIMSQSFKKQSFSWDTWEGTTKQYFSNLIDDLERGQNCNTDTI